MNNRMLLNYGEDRFFWMPFILGGLSGAAIGTYAARPRPVYVQNSYPTPYNYPYYNGYGYSNYNYYY